MNNAHPCLAPIILFNPPMRTPFLPILLVHYQIRCIYHLPRDFKAPFWIKLHHKQELKLGISLRYQETRTEYMVTGGRCMDSAAARMNNL